MSTRSQNDVKILFVDDNDINRRTFQAVIEDKGFIFKIVETGQEAIDSVKSEGYNCVVADLKMPVIDGFEVARQVREWAKINKKHIKLYALTGSKVSDIEEDIYASGFSKALSKGRVNSDFVDTILDDFLKK